MKTLIRSLLVTLTSFTFAATASAQTLVQWGAGNDIVTSTFSANRNSISASTATSINPGANVNGYYNGTLSPAGRSAIFYGTVYNSTDGNSRLQVSNVNPDTLRYDGSNGTDTSAGRTFAGLTFWQKSDGFLTSGNITWSDIDSITWATAVNASSARGETRFVVRNGASDFYISNNLGIFTSASSGTATKANATSWFDYTPTSSILTIGAAATPTLNDITAIGFMFSKVNDFTTIANTTTEFSVTVIPEPSSAMLLIAGAGSLLFVRRRKNRA